MLPVTPSVVIISLYIIEQVYCSGPDFSDIRYLGNNGYQLPSQAIYKKVYGGHGKRYGVHFPGPNEGYGLHNAHDKDPGGIDYKDFGWNYKKYIYPKILPQRHHYDGNAIYDDPGQGSVGDKEKPKINLYIYNFDKESKNANKEYAVRKYTKSQGKVTRKWRKSKGNRKPTQYKSQDPYEIYEPVKKHYALYENDDIREYEEEDSRKVTEKNDEKYPAEEYNDDDKQRDDGNDHPKYAEAIDDLTAREAGDDYRAVVVRRRHLSRTYDVSAGACGYKKKTSGHCWGLEPQLYRHPNPMCYIQCDNMGNTFIRMCAKGTLWRARDYASYNACV